MMDDNPKIRIWDEDKQTEMSISELRSIMMIQEIENVFDGLTDERANAIVDRNYEVLNKLKDR